MEVVEQFRDVMEKTMLFSNESEFEAHIRGLICEHITAKNPSVYVIKNKKAVDILLSRDTLCSRAFLYRGEVPLEKTWASRIWKRKGRRISA